MSLDLPTASDTSTGTVEPNIATGTTGTGDTDLGLAAAVSGTETTHGDEDAGTDANALPGTTFVPPSTDSAVESVESASATAPGESVYAEPTPQTAAAETPVPVSASGETSESGAATTEPSPTLTTTAESGAVSVELGAVSAPISASSDAVSIDLGPPSSVAGTLSADPSPPVLATGPHLLLYQQLLQLLHIVLTPIQILIWLKLVAVLDLHPRNFRGSPQRMPKIGSVNLIITVFIRT